MQLLGDVDALGSNSVEVLVAPGGMPGVLKPACLSHPTPVAAYTLNPKPKNLNSKPEKPKPETWNPKPETRNPKPETRSPKPAGGGQGLDGLGGAGWGGTGGGG